MARNNAKATNRLVLAGLVIVILAIVAGAIAGTIAGGGRSTTAAASSGQGPTWINKIKERGELRVGCADARPVLVVESDGTCTGPTLLPLQEVAKTMGVKFTTVATTWQNMVAGLQSDKYDIAADLDQTVERTLSIQYTSPAWSYPGVFLVKRDSGLKTAEQILSSTTPVAVAQGTPTDRAVSEVTKTEPLRVDTFQNAASAVNAGRANALFTDIAVAVENAKADPSWGIVVPNPRIMEVHVGYGVPASVDSHSLQVLNIAVDQSVVSGDIARAFADAGYVDVQNLGALEIK